VAFCAASSAARAEREAAIAAKTATTRHALLCPLRPRHLPKPGWCYPGATPKPKKTACVVASRWVVWLRGSALVIICRGGGSPSY